MKHIFACVRYASTSSLRDNVGRMKSWRISRYGLGNEFLSFNQNVRIPAIFSPNDILIKVKAASVNPIDLRMREGYGKTLLNAYRRIDQKAFCHEVQEMPLTLGRDCSGIVEQTGRNVTKFRRGDEVWCAIGAEKRGCFSEFVLANDNLVSKKPKNLTHVEAAAIPYVACTVWPALCTIGRLHDYNGRKCSVLVHAGSGGVGTFAIQLAKKLNARVTTTCSKDAKELLASIGANHVIDYNANDVFEQLANCGPFDIILDSVNTELSRNSIKLLGLWRGSVHVNICNPLLTNSDNLGFAAGLLQSGFEFSTNFFKHALDGRMSVWAYVYPNAQILDSIKPFVDDGSIKPVVQEVFSFENLDKAFDRLDSGKVRGKIVIQLPD